MKQFMKSSSNMILVGNYNCVKGLEFSEVLLVLDADEYHLKQFIPESIARCMSNLAILVRPKPKRNLKSGIVSELVDHWKESNYQEISKTGQSILTTLKLKFCSRHSSIENGNCKKTHCRKDTSKHTSYKTQKRSEWYRNLSAKIQHSFIPNLHLETKRYRKKQKPSK